MRFTLLIFLSICTFSFGQTDTITIVSYNLLNFPDGRDDCGSNTVIPNRADTLRKILQYTNPDIFVACEIQTEAGADSILTRSLNVYGADNYSAANFHSNNSGSSLHNMLYYNADKLTLQWQDAIMTSSRDIDHYVLYVNDPSLNIYFDTTFIEVYMCHLKAGNSSANAAIRAEQTQQLMDYIAARPSDRNHFVCGDMNVYTSSESGYQQMITGPFALKDPINSPGSWNNNGSFAQIHTQSTRSGANFDCGSQGGSDDRFDQILASNNVIQGFDSLKFLNGSYDAVGNDGNHYNTNLLASPTNTQYPDSIVRALYYMSDHLPVSLKAVITYPTSNGLALFPVISNVSCFGFSDGEATIVPNDGQAPYTFLWDNAAGNQTTATASNLTVGSYCVQVTDNLGEVDNYCLYVPQPAALAYSTFLTPNSGNCNGVAHLVIQSGTGSYTVEWNDPLAQTGLSAYNLCSGIYEATVTDDNGCVTIVEVNILTVDINELSGSKARIYPNPAHNTITVQLNDNHEVWQGSLIDASGRTIKTFQLAANTEKVVVDVLNLTQGFYTLTLKSKDFNMREKIMILGE